MDLQHLEPPHTLWPWKVQRSVQQFLKENLREDITVLPANPAVPKRTVYSNGVGRGGEVGQWDLGWLGYQITNQYKERQNNGSKLLVTLRSLRWNG